MHKTKCGKMPRNYESNKGLWEFPVLSLYFFCWNYTKNVKEINLSILPILRKNNISFQ